MWKKEEKKRDLRDGMWGRATVDENDNTDRKFSQQPPAADNRGPELAKPGFGTQAEGQATHE